MPGERELSGFLSGAMFQTPAGDIYGNDELEDLDVDYDDPRPCRICLEKNCKGGCI